MKKSAVLCAIVVATIGSLSMCANINGQENTCSIAREYEQQPLGPLDGMFFSSRDVVDNICYGKGGDDSAYYLIYDDIDAGLTYEAIRVSQETYAIVLDCLERGVELDGTLKATKDYETVVYELQSEN